MCAGQIIWSAQKLSADSMTSMGQRKEKKTEMAIIQINWEENVCMLRTYNAVCVYTVNVYIEHTARCNGICVCA